MGKIIIASGLNGRAAAVWGLDENVILKGLIILMLLAFVFLLIKYRSTTVQLRNMRNNVPQDWAADKEKIYSVNERLQLALNASNGGVWEVDLIANTVTVDDTIKKILDLSLAEQNDTISVEEWNQIIARHFSSADFQKALPVKDITAVTDTIIYSEYNQKYLHCYAKPVYDNTGKVIRRIGLTVDVTERERLVRELTDTKNTFNVALQSANAGYWEIPFVHGKEYVMYYEENFAKLFRIGHMNPFTTTEWSEYLTPILDPVEYADFHNFLRNFDESVEKVVTNALLKFPDGTETYIKNSAQVAYDRNGKPVKMIGLSVDFTERIKSLEIANRMSQTLLNSMKQMIYVAEIDTDEVVFVNDVMLEAFHVEGDYRGKKYWEIIIGTDITRTNKVKEKLNQNPDEVVIWEGYQPYLKRELSCVAKYISWIDGRTVLFRTYFDISEIKRAERAISEQLKQQQVMAEISKEFILLGDVEGAIDRSLTSIGEFLNCYRVVLALLGKDGDTMKNDYEWFNPQIVKGPRRNAEIKFSQTKYSYHKVMVEKVSYAIIDDYVKYPHLREDPNLKSIMFVPLYVDGEFFGVLEIMKSHHNGDWTEGEKQLAEMAGSTFSMFFSRQKVAENLVQAMLAAENANNAKSAFLSNMSHEIRTPLNAIIGMTNIAMKEDLPDTTRKYLHSIKNASDVLLDVINNVLDMSKIEAAKLELTNEYFELSDILENLYNIVSVRANEKNQSIEFVVEEDVPEAYNGDSFRLIQIMTNILYNAIKFSRESTPISMKVSLDSLDSGVAAIRFKITDQGVGMTEEQKERLFKPFEQGDKRTVRKYGGTGLGLAIAKQIAELMGGDIMVESEPGKGSCFTIILHIMVMERREKTCRITEHRNTEETDLTGKTILLVEDVEINREIVKAILEYTNITIEEAENGRIGVDMIRENPGKYDMVLMDIQMPEMDGYTATREIRQLDRQIPIVAMTAHAFREDMEKSLAVGMNDHIIKPLNEKVLLEKVLDYTLNTKK